MKYEPSVCGGYNDLDGWDHLLRLEIEKESAFLAHNYPDGKKSLFHNAHYVGEFHAMHFSFTF